MEMRSVIESFISLCDAPVAWAIVAVLTIKTVQTIVAYVKCPLLGGGSGLTPDEADALVQRRHRHSPRFLVLTLIGLALAVGGLYALSTPYGSFALAAIVLGAFILIVEPTQLQIEENTLRVAAARTAETEALARDRLRGAHRERIALETGLTLTIAAIVAIF